MTLRPRRHTHRQAAPARPAGQPSAPPACRCTAASHVAGPHEWRYIRRSHDRRTDIAGKAVRRHLRPFRHVQMTDSITLPVVVQADEAEDEDRSRPHRSAPPIGRGNHAAIVRAPFPGRLGIPPSPRNAATPVFRTRVIAPVLPVRGRMSAPPHRYLSTARVSPIAGTIPGRPVRPQPSPPALVSKYGVERVL